MGSLIEVAGLNMKVYHSLLNFADSILEVADSLIEVTGLNMKVYHSLLDFAGSLIEVLGLIVGIAD